jgi:hypothetical protein
MRSLDWKRCRRPLLDCKRCSSREDCRSQGLDAGGEPAGGNGRCGRLPLAIPTAHAADSRRTERETHLAANLGRFRIVGIRLGRAIVREKIEDSQRESLGVSLLPCFL